MTTSYKITITTTSGETFTGIMTRRQPEMVNGFVALAEDDGGWRYFRPDDVSRFHFVPVTEVIEEPEEEV
ncbi:hypothetical protein GWD52_21115 [Enterobacteriaceae bacterium 4M9]|nr:hypothetical protein [Enterobacteriaceae bacterium 4M9]